MKHRFSILPLALVGLVSLSSCQASGIKVNKDKEHYVVGISQYVTHAALDAATLGFKESLTEELKQNNRTVSFIDGNCQGEPSLCTVIASTLISRNVDLIMANATAPFQALVNATTYIPIIGTSITSYEQALGRPLKDDTTGLNATGTSDLAPLDKQAEMIFDLVDNPKNIGILYCSSEPNSLYQVNRIEKEISKVAGLKNLDVEVKRYPFVDSNEVEQIARKASQDNDVIYTPTDNTVASTSKTIYAATKNGKNGKRTPIICGEEGPCINTGLATLTISYYDLGALTGKMAADILLGKQDIRQMKVRPSDKFTKKYHEGHAKEAGIPIDDRFDGFVKL